jgi:hypothetical protein
MSWQSKAVWPRGTMGGGDVSTDTHATEEAAKVVCRMLERKGFGGDGKIFPLKTSYEKLCDCQVSDAWRCAMLQNLRTVSCHCKCHRRLS